MAYGTSGDTATNGVDYTDTSGTLDFDAGDTEKTFTVSIIGDEVFEGDETVDLTLSGPVSATLGSLASAVLSIIDDDPEPEITLSAAAFSVTEGDIGSSNLTITATLSAVSGQLASVDYATSDGTATAGSDYTDTSGTLEFQPGDTVESITVPIVGDSLFEGNETFSLSLGTADNASLGNPSSAVLTIEDNDPEPEVMFSEAAYVVIEGDSGDTSVTITATLSAVSGRPVSVSYGTSDDTATNGVDYTDTSGTLNFSAGDTEETFTFSVIGDEVYEGDEAVDLTLNTPVSATLAAPSSAVLTIIDDDGLPEVSFSAASLNIIEGDTGSTSVTITATLSAVSGQPVSVSYGSSAGSAAAGSDYTDTSGTLNFSAGDTEKTFTVSVIGDEVYEGDETVDLTLSGPVSATLGAPNSAVLTIVDDDGLPEVSFSASSYNITEGG